MITSSESFLVKASQPSDQCIKCSLSDHFAFRSPVSIAFLYRNQIPKELIFDALQRTLNDFPIFAGLLSKESGDLYIKCNNRGVRVTVVHSTESLFQSSDLEKLDDIKFVDEIRPYKDLKQHNSLLLMQLTYYNDGMAIGYCWHHSVGDMETFTQFLKALSNSAQRKTYSPPLIPTDRSAYLARCLAEKKIGIHKKERNSKLRFLNFFDLFRLIKQLCTPKKTVYLYFTEDEILRLRDTVSEKTGHKLSKNDVLCAYLLDFVMRCRPDQEGAIHASMVVNIRSRLGIAPNTLGNYVDLVSVAIDNPHLVEAGAMAIHLAIQNYLNEHFQHFETEEFVRKNGGMKKVGRIVPEKMLPPHRNLTISNWSKFGVYSIDFGISAPHLVLPIGRTPLPWVSCIVEGFDNKGLLVTLALPPRAAKRLSSQEILEQVHQYRQ